MRISRVIRTVAAVILISVALISLVVWQLSLMTPSWWSPPSAIDDDDRTRADETEWELTEQVHRRREPEDTWQLALDQDDANAWLAARLPRWIAHQEDVEWPEGVGMVQLRFLDGTITVGAELLHDGERRRIVEITAMPVIHDGQLSITVVDAASGRLPLPGAGVSLLRGLLENLDVDESQEPAAMSMLYRALVDTEPIDPSFTLSDGRIVQVHSLACKRDTIIMQCRTRLQKHTSE